MLQKNPTDLNIGTTKLFIVVVLYKMKPSESVTLKTLCAAISHSGNTLEDIGVLIYDNTPGGQDPGELSPGLRYVSDIGNGGLAKAYNYALGIASAEGYNWLLTLDQDTNLPIEFISKLIHTAAFVLPLDTVGAIVPFAASDGRIVSPKMITKRGSLGTCFPKGFIGLSLRRAHAVNSASTIRVSALNAIGGYDARFNLWFSDIIMYNRLHHSGYRLFVAGNIEVDHEMSGFDLKTRSTPQRYEDILQAEEAFYDEEMDWVGEIVVLLKLVYRLVYGLSHTGGLLPHFKVALKFLYRRLFVSRKHRQLAWVQAVQRRAPQ